MKHIFIIMSSCLCILQGYGCNPTNQKSEMACLEWAKGQVQEQLEFVERKLKCETSIQSCKKTLHDLNAYGFNAVTTVPDPYDTGVGKLKSGRLHLTIRWLERQSDIDSIRIYEFWPNGLKIVEDYPFTVAQRKLTSEGRGPGWVYNAGFYITERTDPSLRKDGQAWETYKQSTAMDVKGPLFYVARPTDQVHVHLSLIDGQGHESHVLPLKCWIEDGR